MKSATFSFFVSVPHRFLRLHESRSPSFAISMKGRCAHVCEIIFWTRGTSDSDDVEERPFEIFQFGNDTIVFVIQISKGTVLREIQFERSLDQTPITSVIHVYLKENWIKNIPNDVFAHE